jgi:tetratricopeptide (TPR) repeat protein
MLEIAYTTFLPHSRQRMEGRVSARTPRALTVETCPRQKGPHRLAALGASLHALRAWGRKIAGPLALAACIFGSTAHADNFVNNPRLDDSAKYEACLKLAHTDPDTTYEDALQWQDAGGGAAAVHCSAVALVQLKHYDAAATKLDDLARAPTSGSAGLREQLLDQAGNAWLLAGQPENAEASLSAAIDMGGRSADLYADRGRARGMRKDWAGAEADLTVALSYDEYRSDLLVLRGSARHALGKRKQARADIDAALDVDPRYADALVERGAMKLEDGDKNGARADWTVVLATQPNSPAADSARMHIEQLEIASRVKKPIHP